MDLTIDQMLQQGVAAHNQGNLQESERLYRAILQVQPMHPDANHNLGLIAVVMDQPGAALPLFKVAFETSPNVEQYWISYIDALIKSNQFKNAKKVLKKAKKFGIANEKLFSLGRKLMSTANSAAPSRDELNSLLEHYQNERYEDAEKLAITISKQFTHHNFSLKVLGEVLKKTGRISEAVIVSQKAVDLNPQDTDANYNLGTTLQELGRLEEAEKCFRHAIELKPDFFEAFSNLGLTLHDLGRLDEAEECYNKAIKLNPNFAEAYNNLGNTLQELERLEEAEESYKKVILLKPNFAEAHNNLGNAFEESGKLEEAISSYKKAIILKPAYAEAHYNLGFTLKEIGRLEASETYYRQAIELKSDYAEAFNNLSILLKELGRLEESEENCRQAISLNPNFSEAHNNLGATLKEQGRLDDSEASYNQAILLNPGYTSAIMNRWKLFFEKKEFESALIDADFCDTKLSRACGLETLYALGRIDEIYQRIENQSKDGDENIRMAAFASFLSNVENRETANNFCNDPMDFIHFANISTYVESYIESITDLIDELHGLQTIWEPSQKATRRGFQTPTNINLFSIPSVKLVQLKAIIIKELDLYFLKFKNKSCSYIKKWPANKNLFGWQVILKHQGHQFAHIHSSGWLSGVIYLKVVPSLGKDEGAIEFSLNGENYSNINTPKLTYQPEVGDIIFFPSSLHHRTIPFTTDTDRMIISFDLMPEIAKDNAAVLT